MPTRVKKTLNKRQQTLSNVSDNENTNAIFLLRARRSSYAESHKHESTYSVITPGCPSKLEEEQVNQEEDTQEEDNQEEDNQEEDNQEEDNERDRRSEEEVNGRRCKVAAMCRRQYRTLDICSLPASKTSSTRASLDTRRRFDFLPSLVDMNTRDIAHSAPKNFAEDLPTSPSDVSPCLSLADIGMNTNETSATPQTHYSVVFPDYETADLRQIDTTTQRHPIMRRLRHTLTSWCADSILPQLSPPLGSPCVRALTSPLPIASMAIRYSHEVPVEQLRWQSFRTFIDSRRRQILRRILQPDSYIF